MIVRPGQLSDVGLIIENISQVSAHEMVSFGNTPWDMVHRARNCMPKHNDRGLGLDCIVEDGKPLALFGAILSPDSDKRDSAWTWFMASQEYFDRGVKSTVFSRQHMAKVAADHGKVTFHARSASEHPMVDRWFEALGFAKVSELDLFRVYRYCREMRTSVGRLCAR